MKDLIHVNFEDVSIRFTGAGTPRYYSMPPDIDSYYAWMTKNLKKNTYLIYPTSGMAQMLSEDLVAFTLKFGNVYEVVERIETFTKVEKLLINAKYEEE